MYIVLYVTTVGTVVGSQASHHQTAVSTVETFKMTGRSRGCHHSSVLLVKEGRSANLSSYSICAVLGGLQMETARTYVSVFQYETPIEVTPQKQSHNHALHGRRWLTFIATLAHMPLHVSASSYPPEPHVTASTVDTSLVYQNRTSIIGTIVLYS